MSIKDFMKNKGKKLKDTKKEKPTVDFSKMKADEKWALVEKLLRDLGYIN
jgi:hypothetical protein